MIFTLHLHFIIRRQKEIIKALETPEEKRARRLAKKASSFSEIKLRKLGSLSYDAMKYKQIKKNYRC